MKANGVKRKIFNDAVDLLVGAEEIGRLNRFYFNIILAEDYDVTIQSKNTEHIWYIHNGVSEGGEVISTGLPSRTISRGEPGVWGRRYGALWGMICFR